MSAGLSLKTRSVLLSALVVLPAFARMPLRDPAGGQAHVVLAQELVACACAAIAVWLARGWPRDRIAKLVTLLVVLEVLSGALATNPWAAIRAAGLWIAGLAVFSAARTCVSTPLPLFAVGAVALSVILETFGLLAGWSRSGHAPGGLLGERNAASELLVCAMPFVVAVGLRASRASLRAFAFVALGLSAAAAVMTRTRTAWLAMAALALLGLFLALRTSNDALRARGTGAVLAVAVGLSLALAIPPRIAWTSSHPYRETLGHLVDRGSPRLVQYATTLEMATGHPLFGVGPGNWSGQYLAFAAANDPTLRDGPSPTNRLPSSDVLGFVAERGVPAACAALAIAALLLRGRDRDRWLRRATLLAVLVVGSLDAVLQLGPHLLLVAWILGTTSRSEGTPAPRASWSSTTVAATGFAALRLAAFLLATRGRSFDDLERAAQLDAGNVPLRLAVAESWIEAGDCDRARPHLAAAMHLATPSPAARSLAERCGQSAPRSMRSSSALLETPSFSYRLAR